MEESVIQTSGARLWTARAGRGTPIVLCSGGPGCCDYLGPVAAMIDDIADVIRWEQRGCGRSSPDGPFDLHTCLRDLEDLRIALSIDRWIVAGHSWGANLALAYALDHADRCLGLIYLCGTGLREDWKESYRRARDERGERIPEFAFPFNRQVNAVGNRSFSEYLRSPGLRERVAALRVPALLVAAGRDLRPTAPARELAGLLPHVRFELIPDAEHYLWLTDADPLRVILRDFLATFPPVAR